jgi:hypothetical protein
MPAMQWAMRLGGVRVSMRSSLMVFEAVLAVVTIALCQEFGAPLLSSLFTTRIANALFVTSYLLFASLCVILVITIAYDKYR